MPSCFVWTQGEPFSGGLTLCPWPQQMGELGPCQREDSSLQGRSPPTLTPCPAQGGRLMHMVGCVGSRRLGMARCLGMGFWSRRGGVGGKGVWEVSAPSDFLGAVPLLCASLPLCL